MYSRKCGIYTLAVKDLHFIYTNLKTIWFQNILTPTLVNVLKDIQTCCFLLDWLQVAAELLFLFSESRIRFAADRSLVTILTDTGFFLTKK